MLTPTPWVIRYHGNCLDEPVFMAVPKPPKPMLTEFGIHYRLESCDKFQWHFNNNSLFAQVENETLSQKLDQIQSEVARLKAEDFERQLTSLVELWTDLKAVPDTANPGLATNASF